MGPVNNTLHLAGIHNVWNKSLTAFIKYQRQPRRTLEEEWVGAVVIFKDRADLNTGKKWSNIGQEQGGGNLLAIALASMVAGIHTLLTLNIRSYNDLAALTEKREEYEDKGFIGVKNAGILRIVIGCLRMHTSPVYFQDLKDLPTSREETAATKLAKATLQDKNIMVLPPIPAELHLTGAKLSKMTQARAYRAIRLSKSTPTRVRTGRIVEEVKRAVGRVNKRMPTNAQVWSSLHNKDLSKPMRVFI